MWRGSVGANESAPGDSADWEVRGTWGMGARGVTGHGGQGGRNRGFEALWAEGMKVGKGAVEAARGMWHRLGVGEERVRSAGLCA